MQIYLLGEIQKLRADKLSREKTGSIIMSINQNLKKLKDREPKHDAEGYNDWEERYYEVKHLGEYADALANSVSSGDIDKINAAIDDIKAAAEDFQLIYGGLETWRIK
ncbi:MAG: hypothetical protein PUD92_05155 [Clostridiales bacterium]|nr:hypothetical protein [Clostridiales bacterium]